MANYRQSFPGNCHINLILAINAITKHSFLARCQANFLRATKESLKANKVIVLGDFAENYQFLVQDNIQSYQQSKEYCTLHLLVVYFIDDNRNIQHNSLCFISDDNNQNTNFVYKIQTILVDYLKENLPIVDKIFYFSDGCAEKYKNLKKNYLFVTSSTRFQFGCRMDILCN